MRNAMPWPLIAIAVFAVAPVSRGEIPPGYEVVRVTNNRDYEKLPRINERGQIVFTRRMGETEHDDEIFLYEHGKLTQLTDDDDRDAFPDINDDGTIVWSKAIGPPGPWGLTYEIIMYKNGAIMRLTDDDKYDYEPKINNAGHVAWSKWVGDGCEESSADIYFYDGSGIRQITDSLSSDQSAVINDLDQIAWTRYDFCADPWDSDILLYDEQGIQQLDQNYELGPQVPSISNSGAISWSYRDVSTGRNVIQIWSDGNVTELTNWGWNPKLNDRGDVYFIRWYDDLDAWQPWLYMDGTFYRLADEPVWSTDGDINNVRDVVWQWKNYPTSDILLMRRAHGKHNDKGTIGPPRARNAVGIQRFDFP